MAKGKRYIPDKDAEFDEWVKAFNSYVSTNYLAIGVSATEKSTLGTMTMQWSGFYTDHLAKKAAARAAAESKDEKRDGLEDFVRSLAKRITSYSGTTDADRESLGITVADKEPSPIPPDYVRELPPPNIVLDWSKRNQITIHFGTNPANEKANAKPKDIACAKIWFRTGMGGWEWLADDSSSPYVHSIGDGTALVVEYKAQWVDKKMRVGTISEVAKCTVNP
jgi:hypothetical protein